MDSKTKIMEEQKIQQLNRFKIERENTIQYPIKELLKDSINEWLLSDIQQINVNESNYGSYTTLCLGKTT